MRIFAGGRGWEGDLWMIEVKKGPFSDFTSTEIDEFKKLVLSEGRVNERTLPVLMERAKRLVMLFDAGRTIGTSALKTPSERHRQRVFRDAGLTDQENRYPSGPGWIVVHPDHRGR